MWVDLTAGPVSYGPRMFGEGGVTEHSFPRVASFPSTEIRKVGLSNMLLSLPYAVLQKMWRLSSPTLMLFNRSRQIH